MYRSPGSSLHEHMRFTAKNLIHFLWAFLAQTFHEYPLALARSYLLELYFKDSYHALSHDFICLRA